MMNAAILIFVEPSLSPSALYSSELCGTVYDGGSLELNADEAADSR
jgi:hypothetical protein